MSDLMLHGKLNMPLPDEPQDCDVVTWVQFKAAAKEASDRIEEIERNILAAERRLKRLARWLDLSDEELKNLTIGSIVDDHRKMQADVNAAIAALKGETDE